MPMLVRHFFEFGPYRLDVLTRRLLHHGEPVALTPKALDALLVLLENRERVVEKAELMQRLWPDSFVEEANLTQTIFMLRRALGESEGAHFIETAPRHGYRFAADVVEVREGPGQVAAETAPSAAGSASEAPAVAARLPAAGESRRGVRLAAVTLLAVSVVAVLVGLNVGGWRDRLLGRGAPPPIKSLAVLPLENLSGDPQQEYFVDGMTDALITDLARLGSLRVISRTSTMRYKGAKKALPEIARELDVDAVVEGTVARSGQRVRVNVQLLHARTDHHLWAESYERDQHDIPVLQDEIARAIAGQIRVRLTPQEQARLTHARPSNIEAYELYLKGRYFWNKRTVEGFHQAVEHFQQAVEKDPSNALAYCGLADAYVLYGQFPELPIEETRARALGAATRALKLDDTLAEAHTSLAFIRTHYDWDWPAAEKEFRRAIQLNPNYATAHHWYAYYWVSQGRMSEALAEIHRARELDPLSLIINTDVAEMFYYAGRHDEAIQQARKVLEMDPNFSLARQILAWAYLEKHLHEDAIRELETAIGASGRGSQVVSSLVASLGVAYARAGRRAEARQVLRELKAGSREEPWFHMAWVYTALGENDRALASIEKAYQQRAGALILLKALLFLEPLHSDPRFQDLVRRVGLPS